MAKTKKKIRTTKSAEEAHIGSEPSPGSDLSETTAVANAYGYYNYFYGRKEAIQYLYEYLESKDKELLQKVKRVNDADISKTLGWIARLLSRKCILSDATLRFFNSRLVETIETYTKPAQSAAATYFTGPKDKPYIADLENELDQFVLAGYKSNFDFVNWAAANEIGPLAMGEIASYYRPVLEEVIESVKDKELKEAYGHLTAANRKALAAFLGALVAGSETALENRKRTRKPRQKKAVPAEKLVKGIKCLEKDPMLNIASISPVKIVGSSQLIVFNTKNRKLVWYVAEDDKKLEVKGSSVIHYDKEKSLEKTVRKPGELLPVLLKAGKRETGKLIKGLTTKDMPVDNGRINKHCLLLQAFQ